MEQAQRRGEFEEKLAETHRRCKMPRTAIRRLAAIAAVIVALICVLGFYHAEAAAPKQDNEPFANSVEQRMEIISQLKELNRQIKEQNELLRSGKLRVEVVLPAAADGSQPAPR
jgi:hypothetical protein